MASQSSGTKAKLKITPCVVNDGMVSVDSSRTAFEAMINPSGYEHSSSVKYTKNKTFGQPGSEAKYNATCGEKITLQELVLDGTGVATSGTAVSVKDQISLLRDVAYTYLGKEHEPPVVQVSWGPLLFYARIESMKVSYTLFKPSGDPLRAKLTLEFVEYQSTAEISKEANQSSPDLTHVVEVKAGDTLPMLCYRIYKDCSYYLEIARLNQLTNFRQLQPGQTLSFPPLQ